MKQFLCVTALLGMLLNAHTALGGARSDDPLGIAISPHALMIGAIQSGTVLVHTDIPLSAVNCLTLTLELDETVSAYRCYADSLGNLVAVFREHEVKSIVWPPSAELTLSGDYVNGEQFFGSDTVRVEIYSGR